MQTIHLRSSLKPDSDAGAAPQGEVWIDIEVGDDEGRRWLASQSGLDDAIITRLLEPAPSTYWRRFGQGLHFHAHTAVPGGDSLYPFAMLTMAAARAAGITPFGSVGKFADFADLDGYRDGLRRSRALGFSCTACIHPAQVAVVNEEYGVSEAQLQRARRLIDAFEQALAQGQGAVAFEGAMVDLPVAQRARALLARAR